MHDPNRILLTPPGFETPDQVDSSGSVTQADLDEVFERLRELAAGMGIDPGGMGRHARERAEAAEQARHGYEWPMIVGAVPDHRYTIARIAEPDPVHLLLEHTDRLPPEQGLLNALNHMRDSAAPTTIGTDVLRELDEGRFSRLIEPAPLNPLRNTINAQDTGPARYVTRDERRAEKRAKGETRWGRKNRAR